MSGQATAWWDSEKPEIADELAAYDRYVAREHTKGLTALGTPLAIATAQADHLVGVDGETYLDLRSGGGVFPFGHRPEKIIAALTAALDVVDIGDWQLPSPHRTSLGRALEDTMLDGEWQWRFFASGSETNDFALRTALMATGRNRIAAVEGAYHGQTGLAASVTDARHLGRPYPPMQSEVTWIPRNDLDALEVSVTDQTAVVILEPVQLTDGVRPLSVDFLRALRERCESTGTVVVYDEVKCGLNRTGRVWAHQHAGVPPDIIVAGKALSGGIYPVAACGIRRDGNNPALNAFEHDARSSFGGSHLGMAVASAAIAELVSADNRAAFEANAEAFETELRNALGGPDTGEVMLRRLGTAFDIDLGDATLALFVAADLLHHNVVVPFPKSAHLVLLPSFTLSKAHQKTAASRIADSIATGLRALDGQDGIT